MKFLEVDFKPALADGLTKECLITALEKAKQGLTWYVCDSLRSGHLEASVAARNAIAKAMNENGVSSYRLMEWAVRNNPGEALEYDFSSPLSPCPPSALAYRKAWIDHMIEELKK